MVHKQLTLTTSPQKPKSEDSRANTASMADSLQDSSAI